MFKALLGLASGIVGACADAQAQSAIKNSYSACEMRTDLESQTRSTSEGLPFIIASMWRGLSIGNP